ncbi:unnamed protein product, partial [Prorocentrum cordatum]
MAYCGLGPILRKARQEQDKSDDDEERVFAEEATLASAFRRAPPSRSSRSPAVPELIEAPREAGESLPLAAPGKQRLSKAERKKAKRSAHGGAARPAAAAAPAA